MTNWLQNIKNRIEHKIKLTLYKWCVVLLKKLRIYHSTDLITKANSREGFEWNDVLLMGVKHQSGDYYYVMYCKPGVAFAQSIVHIDDLITGKANLTVSETKGLGIKRAVEEAITDTSRFFPGGIERIGYLPHQTLDEPAETLYRDGAEHEALKAEIKMEYDAKLAEQERVRNERESNMYRGSRTD